MRCLPQPFCASSPIFSALLFAAMASTPAATAEGQGQPPADQQQPSLTAASPAGQGQPPAGQQQQAPSAAGQQQFAQQATLQEPPQQPVANTPSLLAQPGAGDVNVQVAPDGGQQSAAALAMAAASGHSAPAAPPPPLQTAVGPQMPALQQTGATLPQSLPGVPGTQLRHPPPVPPAPPRPMSRSQSNAQSRRRSQSTIRRQGTAQAGFRSTYTDHEPIYVGGRLVLCMGGKGPGKGKQSRGMDQPSTMPDPNNSLVTITWHPEHVLHEFVTNIVYRCPCCTNNMSERGWTESQISGYLTYYPTLVVDPTHRTIAMGMADCCDELCRRIQQHFQNTHRVGHSPTRATPGGGPAPQDWEEDYFRELLSPDLGQDRWHEQGVYFLTSQGTIFEGSPWVQQRLTNAEWAENQEFEDLRLRTHEAYVARNEQWGRDFLQHHRRGQRQASRAAAREHSRAAADTRGRQSGDGVQQGPFERRWTSTRYRTASPVGHPQAGGSQQPAGQPGPQLQQQQPQPQAAASYNPSATRPKAAFSGVPTPPAPPGRGPQVTPVPQAQPGAAPEWTSWPVDTSIVPPSEALAQALREFAFTQAQRQMLQALQWAVGFNPVMYVPRWVLVTRNDNSPIGWDLQPDERDAHWTYKDTRWRCQLNSAHEYPAIMVPPGQLANALRESGNDTAFQAFCYDFVRGLTGLDCMMVQEAVLAQMMTFATATAETYRLAHGSVDWSRPHEHLHFNDTLRSVQARLRAHNRVGVQPQRQDCQSPHVVGTAYERFSRVMADAQCEAATFGVAALHADPSYIPRMYDAVHRTAHGEHVAQIAMAIIKGVQEFGIRVASLDALRRVQQGEQGSALAEQFVSGFATPASQPDRAQWSQAAMDSIAATLQRLGESAASAPPGSAEQDVDPAAEAQAQSSSSRAEGPPQQDVPMEEAPTSPITPVAAPSGVPLEGGGGPQEPQAPARPHHLPAPLDEEAQPPLPAPAPHGPPEAGDGPAGEEAPAEGEEGEALLQATQEPAAVDVHDSDEEMTHAPATQAQPEQLAQPGASTTQ